jgi:hypothetical protein
MNFFNKLPTITYDGQLVRNIMSRAKLSDATKNNNQLFFEYTNSGEVRADTLSYQYYKNPGYSWLIWFANEVIDPYYDMALNSYDFEQFIIAKYGSIELAQRKIIHYKLNWETNQANIPVDEYNSLLNGAKKYWEPALDYNLNVKSYIRKKDDQILNTNRVGSIDFINATGTFKQGEEIQQINDATIYGFCTYADDTTLTMQHLQRSFRANTTVVGKESGAQAQVVAVNNFLATTAAYTNSNYWSPVTYYDYEYDLNEKKKQILLMDAMQAPRAEQELIRVMNTQ